MNASFSPEDRLSCLVESLIVGFEDLLNCMRVQIANEKTLRDKIEFAANEYERLLAADSSHSDSSVTHSLVAKQLRQLPPVTPVELSSAIQQAQLSIHTYKMTNVHKIQESGARCPVAHKTQDPEDLERDFTTAGVHGTLGCPFARMAEGLPPTAGQEDPIAAEFHQDKISSRSPTTEQRPTPCPIRFLDKHSPEEVAQYFENHKHEIPRSHEICVRRYQQNEDSARMLDAKYGSLVNMIQGLGVKHKAYLPERDRAEEQDKNSIHAVEKWAENVSSDQTPAVHEIPPPDDEPRQSRFEQTLREVRVGESPSRPWGISVPAGNEPPPSALQSENGLPNLEAQPESPPVERDRKERKCPIDHGQANPSARTPKSPPPGESKDVQRDRTQIIFNGPVFFGYSAEQVAALLQNTTLGNASPAARS